MKRAFQLVVAISKDYGIGTKGTLPWQLPGDMRYFKELTSKTSKASARNAVIMGRATWESIPEKFRPLPGRLNIVLTRNPPGNDENSSLIANRSSPCSLVPAKPSPNVLYARSLDDAMSLIEDASVAGTVETVFVIGGGQVYEQAVKSDRCQVIHLTRIEASYPCDTFFPNIDEDESWRIWSSSPPKRDSNVRYSFQCYVRQPTATDEAEQQQQRQHIAKCLPPGMASRHQEHQYLDLVQQIIQEGTQRQDRTGTGTLSRFGVQLRFDLRHNFPLLTTKRVFWRGVVEELLWFIAGSTNAKDLQSKGVHIWDGNSSREFLDALGLSHREEGDLGPVYGFQWRHFGAQYKDMHTDYTGQGVDQLADLVHRIKTNPEDRRLILNAWNPAALKEVALPPCHMMCQFYVAEGELSCQLYQRSADLGLGVPFNIASYALLTCMIAQVCGLQPGEFVHTMGDAHVYLNHVEPLKQQLLNSPRPFPRLVLNPEKKDIDSFDFSDFKLVGYSPHKTIKMEMAV